jgi:hypothetical protein
MIQLSEKGMVMGTRFENIDRDTPMIFPPDKAQFNFTDEKGRIMNAGNDHHYEQVYNPHSNSW